MSALIKKIKNYWHLFQSILANIVYAFPQKKLKLIGVTGTDGKTTTTLMIYHILKANGFNVAYLSTISAKIGDKELDTGFHVTTPDPWMVPRYLKMMVDAKSEYVVIESTSQGLAQNRLWGLQFEAAAITNIKSDHLDYHGTWENYALAKASLIEQVKKGGTVALNKDDTKSAEFLKEFLVDVSEDEIKQLWYGKEDLTDVKSSFEGLEFTYNKVGFKLPLIGKYNLENALAAINVCKKYIPLSKISEALATIPTPLGRMQVMQTKPFKVIIDFAHTPHALESALNSIREIDNDARLIVVFGCAGKRDKDRRNMGKVASQMAQLVILTAEDPRDEDLKDINNEIFSRAVNAQLVARFDGHNQIDVTKLSKQIEDISASGKIPFVAFDENSVNSRHDAIKTAISLAKPADIVFITGKAHERSLAFGNIEHPWNEQEEVNKVLEDNNP
ncbi:MAG TPA: UDP-N-acetylmuramyl-tripeptide synthetase [Candidatus Dojkabacteria bacterium]|nr:UDP-N-acetylmuramyl-tripeptide synthetase [Candidatus Dojkabacteria bacterium]